MKILIVEDEKLLADSLKTLLESKGFDVETVYDGISGAEYAEKGSTPEQITISQSPLTRASYSRASTRCCGGRARR